MSTKIYSGYRIQDVSFLELSEMLKGLSGLIFHKAEEEMKAEITKKAIEKYDIAYLEGQPTTSAWREAYNEFCEKIRDTRISGLRNPLTDWSCCVTIYPTNAGLLAYFDCEQKSLTEIWQNHPNIEKYDYWDNTDSPENISEEEWEQRGVEWANALSGCRYGSGAGFKWTFVADNYCPARKPKTMPEIDLQKRAKWVAIHKHHIPENWSKQQFRYINSQEFADNITKEAEDILPLLPPIALNVL